MGANTALIGVNTALIGANIAFIGANAAFIGANEASIGANTALKPPHFFISVIQIIKQLVHQVIINLFETTCDYYVITM